MNKLIVSLCLLLGLAGCGGKVVESQEISTTSPTVCVKCVDMMYYGYDYSKTLPACPGSLQEFTAIVDLVCPQQNPICFQECQETFCAKATMPSKEISVDCASCLDSDFNGNKDVKTAYNACFNDY